MKKGKKAIAKCNIGPIILIGSLGSTPVKTIYLDEPDSIDMGLVCDTVVVEGATVKMKNDGTLTPVVAVTDVPFGTVVVGNRVIGGKVTVKTPFVVVMLATADGTVDEGQAVSCSGLDTNGLSKAKVSVTTNYVFGRCLSGNTTGLAVKIGVYRTPYLI